MTLLDLTGNDISGACIEQSTLVTKYDCPLITLNLSFNALSDRGQAAVANVVKYNRNLKRLFVNNCSFNLRGMNDFISKFHDNQSIEELGLDRPLIANAREGRIIDHLSRILMKNSTLHTLSLKFHNMFDTEIQLLSESMNLVGNLVSLNLEGNKIGVIGAEAIASAMIIQQHRSIQFLGLSYNHVCDDGAIALAEVN